MNQVAPLSPQEAKALAVQIGFDAAGIASPHSPALPAWVRSVLVCMHASESDDDCALHRGTRVRKNHTSRRDAFETDRKSVV
mgnify:CR=1 FL=1